MTASTRYDRCVWTLGVLAAVCLGATVVAADVALEPSPLAIKAGTIVPVAAEPIADGVILIRNGKIDAVGPDVAIPDDAEIIDASDRVVIPGLIDAFTTLAGQVDDERSVTPDIKASDAFDFYGEYRKLLAGGVTTVYVSPGQSRLVGGLGAVVKLAGDSIAERCLDDTAALRITLGERSKNPPAIFEPPLPPEPNHPLLPEQKQLPTTRMAQMAVLRQMFAQARRQSGGNTRDIDPHTQVLVEALRRKLPVRINCHTVRDIHNAVSLASEFKLDLIIEGATEAYKTLGLIQRSGAPVVLRGLLRPGQRDPRDYTRDILLGRIAPGTAAALAGAGIKLAVSAPTDEAAGDLHFVAGHAITNGLTSEQALRAITLVPAEILGVAHRVGSIEKGKDADLVVLTDQPFRIDSAVDRTIVNGRTVYERRSPGPAQWEDPPTLAVRAGKILTASQGRIDNGLILIRDTRIVYVGPQKDIPDGTTIVDASKSLVAPGLIDVHSHLGLHWESEPATLDRRPATTGPNSKRLNAVSIAYAVAPTDEAFGEVVRRGITSVLLAPATSGLLSGTAALVKTAGDDIEERIVKEHAAVKFSMIGDGPRLARIWEARDLLKRAKEYAEEWDAYERRHREYEHRKAGAGEDEDLEEPARPDRDVTLEPFRALFDRKVPAIVHARRSDEIRNALEVFRDEYNLDVIVLGGDDSFRVATALKDHRVGVAIGPEVVTYERGRPVNNADVLARNGLPVAFHTSATSGTQYLSSHAAYAVRHGMDKGQAFRAITSYPAQMLNVNDRIGSIEVGKDADLVVLSGEPLEFTTRVERVIVNGEVVFDSSK